MNDITVSPESKQPSPISISGKLQIQELNAEDIDTCNRLYNENKFQACYDFAHKCLKTNPSSRVALLSIAKASIKLANIDETFAILFSIIRKNPKDTQAIDLLATAYRENNQNDKGLICAKRALEIDDNNAGLHANLAFHYFNLGQFDKALEHYERAIELKELPIAHFGRALTLLTTKQYKKAWPAFESRFHLESIINIRSVKLDIPFWDKTVSITGKKLVICWEQGIGDNIQFLRFIPLLKQRYQPYIIVVSNTPLASTFKQIPEVDEVIFGKYIISPKADYQICMLSLAYYLDIDDEAKFFDKPYITAKPELVEKWLAYLGNSKKLRIGFCWRGRDEYAHALKRNMKLENFIELTENPNIELISLQRNLTDNEKEILHYSQITSLGDEVKDLTDTAAIIESLDLVISVDTALAHLAGAMGKHVWTLIRYETEWRHPRDADISPWYPSMRLIRQAKPGDWDSVFAIVRDKLASTSPLA